MPTFFRSAQAIKFMLQRNGEQGSRSAPAGAMVPSENRFGFSVVLCWTNALYGS